MIFMSLSQSTSSGESRPAVPVGAKCPLPREYVLIVAFFIRIIHLLCRINRFCDRRLRRSIESGALLQECDERSLANPPVPREMAPYCDQLRQSPNRRAGRFAG
ncbi:hypothetical protein [Aquibium sp. ELW1220]|uniref:hypothetical protein n=1 Tax=Aquibium sp. ELW1220 TaxID=2976766 RepID=UPI0025B000E9|nr:hypothetical protein [Aquibium sp. ELW1220]MDN2583950.1 hypothetical protein [Aquibium sp. ELW1220]